MKLLEVHTCPLWLMPDGSQKVGMEPYPLDGEPDVIGWVNVLVLRLGGRVHKLLAVEV